MYSTKNAIELHISFHYSGIVWPAVREMNGHRVCESRECFFIHALTHPDTRPTLRVVNVFAKRQFKYKLLTFKLYPSVVRY